MDTRYCPMCGRSLAEKARPDAVYCQPSCRSKAFRRSRRDGKPPVQGPAIAGTPPASRRVTRVAPRKVAMGHQLATQAPAGAVGYRLVLAPQRAGDRPSLSPRKRLGEQRPFWALPPVHLPDDGRLKHGQLYRILWVDADGKSVPPKPDGGLPMLHYFLGAPDSQGDRLDEELQALLEQTAENPEYKQLHATMMKQRARRLQQRILAEQAAEQAALDQKGLEEAQRCAAETRRQSEEMGKDLAKMLRKKRKREAKEAKRQGVDWSEWLPLFKKVTSAMAELMMVYWNLKPKLAEMKQQGKDPQLALFLVWEFLKAMDKQFHPESGPAAAPDQPAPAEPASAATVSAAAAPAPQPAPNLEQPSPQNASPAAATPTPTPDAGSADASLQCGMLLECRRLMREMGIFSQKADSPETPKQPPAEGAPDAPAPVLPVSAHIPAELLVVPAEPTSAQLTTSRGQVEPEMTALAQTALVPPACVEFTDENPSEAAVQQHPQKLPSEPLRNASLGDLSTPAAGVAAERESQGSAHAETAGREAVERMAQPRGALDRQRLATAAPPSRVRGAQPTRRSAGRVRPIALITVAVLLGLLLGVGAAQRAAYRDSSRTSSRLVSTRDLFLSKGIHRSAMTCPSTTILPSPGSPSLPPLSGICP